MFSNLILMFDHNIRKYLISLLKWFRKQLSKVQRVKEKEEGKNTSQIIYLRYKERKQEKKKQKKTSTRRKKTRK